MMSLSLYATPLDDEEPLVNRAYKSPQLKIKQPDLLHSLLHSPD